MRHDRSEKVRQSERYTKRGEEGLKKKMRENRIEKVCQRKRENKRKIDR